VTDDDAFARRFAELGATFRAQLPDRLAELRRLAGEGRLDELRAIAHQIAGRGGTFGAPEVTTAARRVEDAAEAELAAALDRLAAAIEGHG
jgi:HPt (histidine-containing phosphotransfer) domain-containing protein